MKKIFILTGEASGDKLASEVLCRGDVLGLTQSESRTMRKTVLALQPKNVYDMALALALIRPAAADGGRKAAYFRSGGKGKRQIITDEDAIEYISDSIGCSMDFADKYRRGFRWNFNAWRWRGGSIRCNTHACKSSKNGRC